PSASWSTNRRAAASARAAPGARRASSPRRATASTASRLSGPPSRSTIPWSTPRRAPEARAGPRSSAVPTRRPVARAPRRRSRPADAGGETGERGADTRPRRERARGVEGRAVEAADTLEQRGHTHLLEHGEPAVGAAAVGPEADPHAALQQLQDGRDAVTEEHVGARAVGERRAARAHQRDLVVVEPHAVHADHPRPEHAEPVEVVDGRRAVLTRRPLALVGRLGDVDVERDLL